MDKVEAHNIANQAFLPQHMGMQKTDAINKLISWVDLDVKNKQYEDEPLNEVVFLLVDSMAERKRIFEQSLKLKINTSLMIETRIGSDTGYVYSINPNNLHDIELWEANYYGDENTETSSCGATLSVGPTNDIVTGYAVWSLMLWLNNNKNIERNKLSIFTHGEVLTC